MNKKVKVLLLFYVFQFIITSCVDCNCNNGHYNKTYNEVEVRAWDTAGFQNTEILDNTLVAKNAFGLSVSVHSELSEIANNKISNLSSLGFFSAYACDCSPDVYDVDDPIVSMKIIVINVVNDEETDATNNFRTRGYDGEEITITELIENLSERRDSFQLDLREFDNIPNTSVFIVKIYLESGIELVNQTNSITFEI